MNDTLEQKLTSDLDRYASGLKGEMDLSLRDDFEPRPVAVSDVDAESFKQEYIFYLRNEKIGLVMIEKDPFGGDKVSVSYKGLFPFLKDGLEVEMRLVNVKAYNHRPTSPEYTELRYKRDAKDWFRVDQERGVQLSSDNDNFPMTLREIAEETIERAREELDPDTTITIQVPNNSR